MDIATPIYFDANVFIEMVERKNEKSTALINLYRVKTAVGPSVVTSELTLAEVLVKPMESAVLNKNYHLVDRYRNWISDKGNVQKIAPISRDILDLTAWLRAKFFANAVRSLTLPDAIHLATALMTNCTTFVSGDSRLNGAAKLVSTFMSERLPNFEACLRNVIDFRQDALSLDDVQAKPKSP